MKIGAAKRPPTLRCDTVRSRTGERRKSLPEGGDFSDFDPLVSELKTEPAVTHLAEITDVIAAIAGQGGAGVYVEILAKPGSRTPKPVEPMLAETGPVADASGVADSGETPPGPRRPVGLVSDAK